MPADVGPIDLGATVSVDYVSEFQLSVTRALRDQLLERLDALTPAALTNDAVGVISRRGGVYQLFEGDALVYVGKSTRDLRGRLFQHRQKLLGREGGILDRVGFRCVYVTEDLDALAPEKMLIDTLRRAGKAAWNTNGFGNKDPGKERDTSLVEFGHFDRTYPINLDLEVKLKLASSTQALELARQLKTALPYNFRFANKGVAAAALQERAVHISDPSQARTVREWLDTLAEALPEGWSVIQLPGYLISYPGVSVDAYASRMGAWVASASGADYLPHEPLYSANEPALS